MEKNVYLVMLIGDMGKDREYLLFEDEEVAWKYREYSSGDLDEEDEYFEKFEEDRDDVEPIKYFFSYKELLNFVEANNLNIVAEFEGCC